MKKSKIAGIDIGSRSIELVVLQGDQRINAAKVPTTFDPLGQCRKIMKGLAIDRLVTTGYGRKLLANSLNGELPVTTITEIQAYARGAHHIHPGVRTVLDIGGQYTKVISLFEKGKVAKFEMNDRCAAGTDKFLEFMAAALQIPIEDFGAFALQADRRIKPLFLLQLPYNADGPVAALLWQEEIYRLRKYLEETAGNRIDREGLRRQIKINNHIRRLLKEIVYQCAGEIVPIAGLDLLPVMESRGFSVDLVSYGEHLEQLLRELEELKKQGLSISPPEAPRILLTGCPVGKGSEKVLRLIEESGGIVVCQENCTGIKSFDRLIDETDEDPYRAIGRHYLQTPCSCLTPNTGRFELIARLIRDFKIQGVVDLTWRCCLTYSVEAHLLQEFLGKNGQTPYLHLETDYSSWDVEQLKTRVEAFLEVVRA